MNGDLLTIAMFIAPPVALAFLAGFAWPRHPLLAGVGVVTVLTAILILTSAEGPAAMAPYAGMLALLAIGPALLMAWVGANVRRRKRG